MRRIDSLHFQSFGTWWGLKPRYSYGFARLSKHYIFIFRWLWFGFDAHMEKDEIREIRIKLRRE